MSRVIANMSMSLDGFIADPDDGVGLLFTWMAHADPSSPKPRTQE